MSKTTQKSPTKVPSSSAILLAVASSTAIETGKSVMHLEALLKRASFRFASLRLAN